MTPVFAPIPGTINAARWWGAGGRAMWIHHKDNPRWIRVYLAHLEWFCVGSGEKVKAGDLVGFSGSTGSSSTGPHLHWSLRVNGEWTDPMDYLEAP